MHEKITATHTMPVSKILSISLWTVQVLLFFAFLMFGYQKLFISGEALAAMCGTPWPTQYPTLLRVTGIIDAAGGLGILLPALTRIQPRLTVLAALGCTVLQTFAITFHASRGEFAALPLNFILLPLVVFVLWGRGKKAPISPR